MLCANVMPRSANASLEQGECVFDGIRMNVSNGIDSLAVIHSLVPCSWHSGSFHCEWIRCEIVSENHIYVLADVLFNESCNRPGFHVVGVEHAKIAVALPNPNDNFLVSTASGESFGLTTFSFPTYVGFVHLKLSVQLWFACFEHRGSDAMAEIPRSFVGLNSQRPLNLASGHALLRLTEQYCGKKPRHKGKVRIVEDRVHSHAELVLA